MSLTVSKHDRGHLCYILCQLLLLRSYVEKAFLLSLSPQQKYVHQRLMHKHKDHKELNNGFIKLVCNVISEYENNEDFRLREKCPCSELF